MIFVNMSELIRRRRSVRTFDGTPLREEDADRIMEFASKVENPFDIPIEWKLLDREKDQLSSPVITGADSFIAGKMQRIPRAEEAFGYTFEKIVLFAESLGIGTTWIAGTMDRKAFEHAMGVSDNEVMPCVSPLGYPAVKMSLRETLMRKGVKADSRFDFEKLFFDGTFEKPLSEQNAGDYKLPLEMVRLGPSATNSQPWRIVLCEDQIHLYEKHSRGYGSNAWDVQKIDMGIAMCHFELGAVECGLHPVFHVEDPCIPGAEGLTYIASFLME
ncbi:MAG: nitroreductase [Parasporobacterium sp.]|nr:nitroreductase [Parasporobacterium sp.]